MGWFLNVTSTFAKSSMKSVRVYCNAGTSPLKLSIRGESVKE